jgi:hypothetical protein
MAWMAYPGRPSLDGLPWMAWTRGAAARDERLFTRVISLSLFWRGYSLIRCSGERRSGG